jgi:hypothetical protein
MPWVLFSLPFPSLIDAVVIFSLVLLLSAVVVGFEMYNAIPDQWNDHEGN